MFVNRRRAVALVGHLWERREPAWLIAVSDLAHGSEGLINRREKVRYAC